MAKQRHPREPQTHALYRFYGAGGTLLYIGITNSIPARLKAHNKDKPWWLGVTNITVEHYPTREAVLEAERRAIVAEKPLYNEVHNGAARWGDVMPPALRPSPKSDELVPICMGCDEPVESWASGLLHIRHRDVSRAEIEWQKWKDPSAPRLLTRGDLLDMPDLVAWQVHCAFCNPHLEPDGSGMCGGCYAISVEECRSWRALLRWSSHLADKGWLEVTNWFDLMGSIARGDSGAPFVTLAELEGAAR